MRRIFQLSPPCHLTFPTFAFFFNFNIFNLNLFDCFSWQLKCSISIFGWRLFNRVCLVAYIQTLFNLLLLILYIWLLYQLVHGNIVFGMIHFFEHDDYFSKLLRFLRKHRIHYFRSTQSGLL